MRPTLPFFLAAASLLVMSACEQKSPEPPHVPAGTETLPAPDAPALDAPAPPLFDAQALGIPMDEASIADGEAIAQTHCAICHGMGQDDSLRADAPPLRYVLSLYSPENLAEDFRAGIHVGHETMPDFVFGDLGMDVLLAYLVSIQETPTIEE